MKENSGEEKTLVIITATDRVLTYIRTILSALLKNSLDCKRIRFIKGLAQARTTFHRRCYYLPHFANGETDV